MQEVLYLGPIGIASPLGGLRQAAAAFRAGLARPMPLPGVQLMFPGDEEPEAATVHSVPAASAFEGVGRLVALLAEALRDLRAPSPLALARETAIFLALPDPEARGVRLARDPMDDDPDDPEERRSALGERLLRLAPRAAGVEQELASLPVRVFGGDQAAFALALAAADAGERAAIHLIPAARKARV